ncbi:hypothetical protein POM88_020627 [Heracleum sosnowskyi]|uniref:NAC domain-containing protein n=1 Tax=Heracleum sosnowskyi TaxID=360622 RepID=A0AAD8MS29_9APIA|nr:hypothetical protein POM88_020627 [Heracleum sosnowskyi]
MSMDSLGPPGFRFYPIDNELLNFYLKPKLLGKDLPCDIIAEKKIYGQNSNPWNVFNDMSTDWMIRDKLKIVYVFTPLTKIAAESTSRGGGGQGKKENYMKTAGCGNWHGETSRKSIMENGRVIGFTRLLVYQINDVDFCSRNGIDSNRIGHWLMHEYVLCGYEDYALCRITVDMSKMTNVKKLCSNGASRICRCVKSKANNKKTTAKVSRSDKATKELVTNCGAKDNDEQVVLNESFYQENMASTTCVLPNYDGEIMDKVLPLYGDTSRKITIPRPESRLHRPPEHEENIADSPRITRAREWRDHP